MAEDYDGTADRSNSNSIIEEQKSSHSESEEGTVAEDGEEAKASIEEPRTQD